MRRTGLVRRSYIVRRHLLCRQQTRSSEVNYSTLKRMNPSRTSQAVALTRAGLDRPHSPDGDPAAQHALCAGMTFSPPSWLRPGIEARTRFFDQQVQAAISAGVRQIVICGAGYDDRALRFRSDGVRFFEVDHPGTQADKVRRLLAIARPEPSGRGGSGRPE